MRWSLSLHLKKRMVKAFVWSVALYGSETWTRQKEDIRRLEAFELWIWRRMMKVPWTEHKTNEEILKMVETERKIMDTIRSRHILRHDWLLRITLEGQIQGKKAYGRPRTMLLDWLLKTEEDNISYEELKLSAQDRSRWSQWRWKPAIWQSTTERASVSLLSVVKIGRWLHGNINLLKSAIPQWWGKWNSDPKSVSGTESPPSVNRFFPLVGPVITASFNEVRSLLLQ